MIYPPDDHFLRALASEIRIGGDGTCTALLPMNPHLCNDQGGVRLGVIAALVDIAGATILGELLHPDRMATVSLSLQSQRAARRGPLMACSSLLRKGSRQLIVSVEVRDGGGAEDFAGGEATAQALLGFSRLPHLPEQPDLPDPATRPRVSSMAHPASRLKEPLLERAGVRVLDAAAGVVEIDNHDWVRNSFGTLNGGVVALLVEFAGELAARARLGVAVVTADLDLYYVGQSGAGPIRSQVTPLRVAAEHCVFRVELRDSGADDKLLSVGNVHAGRLP